MPWSSMPRVYATAFLYLITVAPLAKAHGQNIDASAFFAKAVETISSGRPLTSLNLTATAQWIAGSTHESGTAQLQANIDGSTNVQLNIGPASRTEIQTAIGASHTCQWADASGTSHDILGANCFVAIPWFAPSLFTQGPSRLSSLATQSDDGDVSDGATTLHQISYQLNLKGVDNASAARRVQASTVMVKYDPQTFLPANLEYKIHLDRDDLKSIDVKVVFSNYQPVSGVMLPFHIEKYVNRSLQLSLDINNATIE